MFWHLALFISALLIVSLYAEDWRFPAGFKFGAATSAYQIEGAWNVSDKGESIWDRFTHTNPNATTDKSNGDVACDSYYHWESDIEMVAGLGLHFYRFSTSWTRILPTGFINNISEDGTAYYSKLIDGLLEKGIEPFVTLYHFDLPQTIQDLGGWTNPLIADWFADYAKVVFGLYGNRVKMWITINEPMVVCDVAYSTGVWAPGVLSPDHGAYMCNKNILLAHAKAYRIYDKQFRNKFHGEVSIANLLFWFEPWTGDDRDIAELARENYAGRYSHAIYSRNGGWPPAIEKTMIANSYKKGYNRSTFPAFTQEEICLVRGTFDFYAMNYFSSFIVRKADDDEELYGWPYGDIPDLNAVIGWRLEWPETVVSIVHVYPEGIRRQLNWLKRTYGDMKFVITGNGYPSEIGLKDEKRKNYIKSHLKQLLLAIKMDEINLTHYTVWSLMDGFEWVDGLSIKYGLYEVNFSDPQRPCTPRDSAHYYANVVKNHKLDLVT